MSLATAPKAVFTTGNLMGHVTRMSFTASIGLMAIFAVDLVDMIFISMLGNAALAAAVGYAGTIMFFTNAVSIGLSIAAGTLVAQAIGAGRAEEARERATSVAVYAGLVGLIIPGLILWNLDACLSLLGASGETLPMARSYLFILLPTSVFLGVAMTAMAVLRAYGDAKRSMYATLFGGIANAVLDPIFIFALGLGLQGAAIASVIARIVVFYYAISPAIRVHDGFAWPSVSRVLQDTRAVAGLAAPAVLANVATPVGSAIVLRQMAQHGTDAVAGMAIIGRLMPVTFSVIFALSGAIGPIIGQNFGAKLLDRVHDAYLDALKFVALYVLGAALILFLARGLLADAFGATGLARDLVLLFCGPLALTYMFNGAIYVSNAAFNNLGRPVYSTLVNWGTYTLGTLPFVMAGSALYGAPGILIGQALGTALFSIGAVAVALRLTRAPDPAKKTPVFRSRELQVTCQRQH
ncbi:putative MATE family efflux protein [Litoreibacter ponti]|uniref:Putative MATE family efflux protein n=1 Tax=Litoreibacter ponti TaxID=1510457 RepID=A0A2T6BMS8_9RHOB|nr:MATE family efflux transporter [Litoreibacter ponti]PTX57388.1 putative MATE family efflux protein [Litoreibacter ponti]